MLDDADHPLSARWNTLFRGKRVSEAADIGLDLIRRWQEPQRAYHTIDHLDNCLAMLDLHREKANDPRLVEMALWYHDAVYDPKRLDNEAKSAELAVNDLEWLGEESQWSERVATAIQATATHHAHGDSDIGLVLDIDLAILASDTATYHRFERNVRQEYQHIPWIIFCQGRANILNGFLAREQLYHRGICDEAMARLNLSRAIHALSHCPDEASFEALLTAST